MQKMKSRVGPADYDHLVGVVQAFGEFEKINTAKVVCDNGDVIGTNNLIYSLHSTISVPPAVAAVTTHVWFQDTTGGAWTELADHANLAAPARTFTFLVDGE